MRGLDSLRNNWIEVEHEANTLVLCVMYMLCAFKNDVLTKVMSVGIISRAFEFHLSLKIFITYLRSKKERRRVGDLSINKLLVCTVIVELS